MFLCPLCLCVWLFQSSVMSYSVCLFVCLLVCACFLNVSFPLFRYLFVRVAASLCHYLFMSSFHYYVCSLVCGFVLGIVM